MKSVWVTSAIVAIALRSFPPEQGMGERCAAATHPPASVTAEERALLDRGEVILLTIPIEGRYWPRVCTYKYISADPESSIAVLTDFALQASYAPRVIHAAVVPSTKDSAAKHVAYVIDVPLARDEVDTLREVVRGLSGADGGYALEWHALASTGTYAIDGSATFVPWRNGLSGRTGTLMIWEQAIDPRSWITRIPFIKNKGIAAVHDATRAIAAQIERELASEPELLGRQVAEFRRTLALAP